MVEIGMFFVRFSVILMTILGLPAQSFTIAYFHQKPPLQKTAFDSVLIDTLIASVFFTLSVIAGYMAYFTSYPDEAPKILTLVVCSTFSITAAFFLGSCFVTILLRYFYLKLGIEFMGMSDFQIKYAAFTAKFSFAFLCCLVDNFGPVKNKILPFVLLSKGTKDYEPVFYSGFGTFASFFLIIIATLVTQRKAALLNQSNEEQKKLVKIMTFPVVVTSMMFIYFTISDSYYSHDDLLLRYHLLLLWVFCCFTMIFPFALICKNPRIKDFILTKLRLKNNTQNIV